MDPSLVTIAISALSEYRKKWVLPGDSMAGTGGSSGRIVLPTVFRCVLASLYEGLFVGPSVCRTVGPLHRCIPAVLVSLLFFFICSFGIVMYTTK